MSSGYGAREVDEVAQALDGNLQRLAEETRRRSEALEAARAFAAGATHELRTPLQSALTNLDIAATEAAPDAMRHDSVLLARDQVRRMASSLTAVRRLADAEFADQRWFEQVSLGELADGVVTEELSRHPEARIDLRVAPGLTPVRAWRDGVELAVSNLVRNALVHGALDGADPQVVVTVENGSIAVDDAGPGIPAAERERVVQRFERNTSTADGSGLGLAISNQVAIAHGGRMHISTSPLGGARIVLDLAPI
jgi:two-component system sensor histidine kinase PrrB